MGLAQDFRDAASDIFDAFDDVAFLATLSRPLPGVYDPETGEVTAASQTSQCRVIFGTKPDNRLLSLEIGPTDERMLLVGPTFAPRNGDKIAITARGDGTTVSDQPVRDIIFVDDTAQAGALYTVVGR